MAPPGPRCGLRATSRSCAAVASLTEESSPPTRRPASRGFVLAGRGPNLPVRRPRTIRLVRAPSPDHTFSNTLHRNHPFPACAVLIRAWVEGQARCQNSGWKPTGRRPPCILLSGRRFRHRGHHPCRRNEAVWKGRRRSPADGADARTTDAAARGPFKHLCRLRTPVVSVEPFQVAATSVATLAISTAPSRPGSTSSPDPRRASRSRPGCDLDGLGRSR